MSTTTSHHQPLAEGTNEYGAFKVYEEVPGSITVSFSRSEGMWAAFSMPPEAAGLLLETVTAALRNRDEDRP